MESSATPPKRRLVIRIKLPAQTDSSAPAPRRWNNRALGLLAAGVVVAIVLIWSGIRLLKNDAPESAAQPATPAAHADRASAAASHETPSPPVSTPVETPPAKVEPGPMAALDEVIPAASRNALNTIRGTIRVTIRAAIDKEGKVIAVTADEPGPSRYFLRISLEAARKWTFTPTSSDEQRVALLRFRFNRSGVTADWTAP